MDRYQLILPISFGVTKAMGEPYDFTGLKVYILLVIVESTSYHQLTKAE